MILGPGTNFGFISGFVTWYTLPKSTLLESYRFKATLTALAGLTHQNPSEMEEEIALWRWIDWKSRLPAGMVGGNHPPEILLV